MSTSRGVTRRQALASVGAVVTGSAVAQGQIPRTEPPQGEGLPARLAPREELIGVQEFEEQAKLNLPPSAFSTIAGGDRQAFDRMTFRPRMLAPTTNLDLSVELLGEKLFAPILVGPMADQRQFHPDGELATVRGAAAAKAVMVVSSRSSMTIEQIAAGSKAPLWLQVYAGPDAKSQIQRAVKAGCRAICITVGAAPSGSRLTATPRIDWADVDRLRQGLSVPVLLKGIMTPEDARTAVQHGVQGIVVSNHGGLVATKTAPVEMVGPIAEASGGKVAILVDGSFRLGSDVVKALALGAHGVLIGRPVMWGLAAYGAEGVQSVVEILQTEMGRAMAGCGKANVKALDRTVVRVHKW